MSKTLQATFFLVLLIILCCQTGTITSSSSTTTTDAAAANLRSPRPEGLLINSLLVSEKSKPSGSSSCDQTYGVLPCTTNVAGNLFLIMVYSYLMFIAGKYLSDGSDFLTEKLGHGLVGGLLLPLLGVFPDGILILVSGLSGSTDTAKSQVSVGMGLLAGSTVLLLTVVWGTCVIVGKCDLKDSIAIDGQDTNGYSLTESGISTDIWTNYAARILVISTIPFFIVQLPQFLNSTSGMRMEILVALVVCVVLLICYCVYQVLQPWIQMEKIAYVEHKHFTLQLLKYFRQNALGRLLTEDGEPNREAIKSLFSKIDVNGDNYLSRSEITALTFGICSDAFKLNREYSVGKIMREFDKSKDSLIDEEEFVDGVSEWLNRVKSACRNADFNNTHKIFFDFHLQTMKERDLLDVRGESNEEADQNAKWASVKAVLLLMSGTAIASVFADPLVDALDNLSTATNIPAFFVSFVLLPLATSNEAVSTISTVSRSTRRTACLTLIEIYGSATMHNLVSLAVFLAVVYIRDLTWDFSSEVLAILVVCIVIGVFASFRTTFPLWTSLVALLLYPFSLLLVYVLDYSFDWS